MFQPGDTGIIEKVSPLQGMQQALSPVSPFWSEHDYATDGTPRPYFSYSHDLAELLAKTNSLVRAASFPTRPASGKCSNPAAAIGSSS